MACRRLTISPNGVTRPWGADVRNIDRQRSKVYSWERACVASLGRSSIHSPEFETLQECSAFADPIWRKERARVGLAGRAAPTIERPHRITLPRWTRSRWIVLHELAHHLPPGDQHGPMTEMEMACHISLAEGVDITPPKVRGAALHLVRTGQARWLRHKLVLLRHSPLSPS